MASLLTLRHDASLAPRGAAAGHHGRGQRRHGGSAELSFDLTPAHLAMVDEDGHTGLHSGEFEIVFSRGHGEELVAQAAVQLSAEAAESSRLKTFRKWW